MWAEILIVILGCGILLALAAFANENVYPKGVATRIAEERGIDGTAGRAAHPDGHLLAGHPARRRRHRHDVHRHSAPLRSLRLRVRRQSRGGGPRRHQHALDDHEDVHRHGRPLLDRRGHRRRPSQRRGPGPRHDRRALRHRRGRRGRHLVRGRHRHDPRRRSSAPSSWRALSYGLAFMGVPSPVQSIVAGIVLVVAVGFDSYNRRRGGTGRRAR